MLVSVATIVALAAGVGLALPGDPQKLPTSQTVTPTGRLTTVGTFPTGLAVSPDGSTAVVTGSGAVATTLPPGDIELIDLTTGFVTQRLVAQDASWGAAFAPDGTLFVSGGSTNDVSSYSLVGRVYAPSKTVSLPDFSGSLLLDGTTLYVALPARNEIDLIDTTTMTPATTKFTGVPSPFGLALADGVLYASDWREDKVTAIRLSDLSKSSILVGDHPEGMAVSGDELLVANANDATLSIIDRTAGSEVGRLNLALRPATPTDSASAVTVVGDRAYVTLAASNAVAVVDIPSRNVLGYIPTAWYPSAIVARQGMLHVLDARGIGALPVSTTVQTQLDEAGASPYDTAYGTAGVLESMPVPSISDLPAMSYTVRANNAEHPAEHRIPTEIKHVIYVVRENKTYDEVLGDMPQGNGDPAYALFGEAVTPNAHAMARRWVLADNFYDPAEASKTGHFWTDAADVADIEEREWHSQGGLNDSWRDPANYPKAGLLMDAVRRAGVSYRIYNEELYEELHGGVTDPHQAPRSVYPDQDIATKDLVRIAGGVTAEGTTVGGWKSEFDQFEDHACTGALAATYGTDCSLPVVEYVYIGGDHAAYGEPGKPTPPSSVADNDEALGKLVDLVSHSSYWSSTAIIAVDDDPQSGGDHVSPYRGLILVASPYAKRHAVISSHNQLAGASHFIEEVAGIPPLSQFDAAARPLDDYFTTEPDLTPFDVLPETVPFDVFLPGNAFEARGAAIVGDHPDEFTDDHAATNLMWEMVRGYSLDEFLARRARGE